MLKFIFLPVLVTLSVTTYAHQDIAPSSRIEQSAEERIVLAEKLSEFQSIYDLGIGYKLSPEKAERLNCQSFDPEAEFQSVDCAPKEDHLVTIGAIDNSVVYVRFLDTTPNQSDDQNILVERIVQTVGPPDIYYYERTGWEEAPTITRQWGAPETDDVSGWYDSPFIFGNPLIVRMILDSHTSIIYQDRDQAFLLQQQLGLVEQYWERFYRVTGSLLFFLPGLFAFFVTKMYWERRVRDALEFSHFDSFKGLVWVISLVLVVSLVAGQGGEVCEQQGLRGCEFYSSDYVEPMSGPAIFEFFLITVSGALIGYFWVVRNKWRIKA